MRLKAPAQCGGEANGMWGDAHRGNRNYLPHSHVKSRLVHGISYLAEGLLGRTWLFCLEGKKRGGKKATLWTGDSQSIRARNLREMGGCAFLKMFRLFRLLRIILCSYWI